MIYFNYNKKDYFAINFKDHKNKKVVLDLAIFLWTINANKKDNFVTGIMYLLLGKIQKNKIFFQVLIDLSSEINLKTLFYDFFYDSKSTLLLLRLKK